MGSYHSRSIQEILDNKDKVIELYAQNRRRDDYSVAWLVVALVFTNVMWALSLFWR